MSSASEEKTLDGMSISFSELIRIFVARIWILLVVSVVSALTAFLITYFTVPKTYKATARVYINNSTLSLGDATSISIGDLNASSNLVPTYSNLVKSEYHMLDKVVERSGLDYSTDDLKKMIDCTKINNTGYLDISVTSKNPGESISLANLIVDILPEKVSESIDGSSISLIDPANKAVAVSRGLTKKSLYGFLIGFVAAALYIFIRYVLLDDRIDSEEWVKRYYGNEYPLLTVIPDMDIASKHGYGYYLKRGYYGYYEKTEENDGTEQK